MSLSDRKIIFITLQDFNLKADAGVNRLSSLAKGLGLITKHVKIWGLVPSKSLKLKTEYLEYSNLSFFTVKSQREGKFNNIAALYIGTINLILWLTLFAGKNDIVINYQSKRKFWFVDNIVLLISKIKKYTTVLELTEDVKVYTNDPLEVKIYEKHIAKYDMCYVISSALFSYVSQFNKNVEIISMTVDYERFSTFDNEINKNITNGYIAYCGSINQHKDGVSDLINALSVVSKNYPGIRLKLAGSYFSDYKTEMDKLISEHKLESKIEVTSYLSGDEIVTFLQNSVMAVLARPSSPQADFGFPTKLGEYLASGTPVVVTDISDVSKVLENEKEALIIPPDDSAALASAIEKILSDYDRYKEMGMNGKKAAKNVFNYKVQSAKLLKFLTANAVN
ncbi:MAG: glycosyltransferase [Bacteroidetes bacterium]|nr:glycosyltransferase [Bacteroidota bacterium]